MGILDNLENSMDDNFDSIKLTSPEFESNPIADTDNMGREKFWEDLGRPEETSLAVKLFSEMCCSGCSCGK